jgi:putative colanic acid biosynthesis UDP-glucose lipid carrier transferase
MPKQGALQSNEMFFSAIHRVVDLFVIVFSGWLISNWVYPLEFKSTHILIVLFSYSFIFYFTTIFSPLYNSWRSETIATELKHLLLYWGLSLAVFRFSIDYILINVNVEKSINLEFGMIWQFTIISLLVSYRVILRYLLRWIRAKGLNSRKVVIVGTGQAARQFGQKINENVGLGFDLLGFYGKLAPKEDITCHEGDGDISHNLGDFASLITDAKNKNFDRIYIVLPLSEQHLTNDLINELSDTTVNVYIIPDVFTFELLQSKIENVVGIPSISIYSTPMQGVQSIIKRIEDIVLSIVIIILISPLLLLLFCLVKIISPGPAIFKQTRYGIDGKCFEVYKFRTMSLSSEQEIAQAIKNDPRVTGIGKYLRAHSLDELPQFFNVLIGNMSIVGPRPHAVHHNEEYRKLIQGYMLRHKMKPGITGWAQINGFRGETNTLDKMENRVKYDLEYIKKWSVLFDLYIVFITCFKGFKGKDAY